MDDLIRALPQLLRAAGDAEEVAETAACVAWRRAAGEQLRGVAVPFRLYRKTLVVAVPDTSWRQQLEAISGQLLFRVNSILGQPVVTFIEFRVDAETVRKERERQRRLAREVRTAAHEAGALRTAAELEDAASAIRDEELRRRFLVAAGSYIEAQERK
ncbi:MAG TPA: DUF721 domain-containing protein [Pyrinomonadaceae bacterium]|nr:DUF721 domain-containing protein [Pyrinomonadaceae bacterium]